MAIAVWRPVCDGRARDPHVAISPSRTPRAVLVQVFVANHVAGNVTCGLGALFAAIAVTAPIIEIIVAGNRVDIGNKLVCAGKNSALVRVDRKCLASAGHFAFPRADRHNGGVPFLADIQAIIARTKQIERQIRRVNLKSLVVIQMTQMDGDAAFIQANLGDIVVQVEKGKTGFAPQANRRRSDVQFPAGVFIGPELVAGCEGPVHHGGNPFVGARRLKGNFAVHVAQSRYAARRVILVGHRSLRCNYGQHKRRAEQADHPEKILRHCRSPFCLLSLHYPGKTSLSSEFPCHFFQAGKNL